MSQPEIHIGSEAATGRPVSVPLSLFAQHCLIRGMTGAMKSVFVTYIALQIISNTNACVIFADFGGDRFAFHALRKAAKRVGRAFRFISTSPTDAWDTFNPMHLFSPLTAANLVRATNYWITSLSLHPGEGYAKSYFGDIAYLTTQDLLTLCVEEGLTAPDIDDLEGRVDKVAKKYKRADVAQTEMALRQLSLYPQLRDAPDTDRQILMPRALERGEIIDAFLPGILEPPAAKLGGMITWGGALAAIQRVEDGLPPRELYLIVDEFAVVAQSRAFEQLLTLARKFRIRLILLHQSNEQLRGDARGTDLRPIVADNTAVKLFLTSRGEDVDALRDLSRDVTKQKGGGVSLSGPLSQSTQIKEVVEPELERNDILDASATPGELYLHVANSASGHSEPVRVRFAPEHFQDIFTKETHERFSNLPLPREAKPQMVTRAAGRRSLRQRGKRTKASLQREKMLAALLRERQADETWGK